MICCCCGSLITRRLPSNPNVCFACATVDWEETRFADLPEELQAPNELEQLLDAEGPSVLECFHAVEQAKEAIAELGEHEHMGTPSDNLHGKISGNSASKTKSADFQSS